MMKEKNLISQADIDNAKVKLKPLANLPPSLWVSILFALILTIVVFLLIVFPGLVNYGTMEYFNSDPEGAAVFVDGRYEGATPCRIFIKSGKHEISISYPYFISNTTERNFGGRLLFSLFLPRKGQTDVQLTLADPESLVADALLEYASWTLVGEPSESYQIPMILSESVSAMFADPDKVLSDAENNKLVLFAALRNALHDESLRDATRAFSLMTTRGAAASPIGILSIAKAYLEAATEDKSIMHILGRNFQNTGNSEMDSISMSPIFSQTSGFFKPDFQSTSISGISFRLIRQGIFSFSPENSPKADIPINGFLMASTETTRRQYSEFVKANPYWSVKNMDELLKNGLVNKNYLNDWNSDISDNIPVTNVSYYAAMAFCEWLSKSAPKGYVVTLPSEIQWDFAATLGDSKDSINTITNPKGPSIAGYSGYDKNGISDLVGNVWEWCNDAFSHFPTVGMSASDYLSGPEYNVRGGSWANPVNSIDISARGSFLPDYCSPFLGFRTILVHKEE